MEADTLPSLKLGHRTITTWIGHFDSLFIREHKNIGTEEFKNNVRTEEHKMNFTNKRTKRQLMYLPTKEQRDIKLTICIYVIYGNIKL